MAVWTHDGPDLAGDRRHGLFIKPGLLIACEGFPAQLQQYTSHNTVNLHYQDSNYNEYTTVSLKKKCRLASGGIF